MALRDTLKALQTSIWFGISKLNPDAISMIDPEGFKLLSLEDLASLTHEQSQYLSLSQLNALGQKQIYALSGDALSGLQGKVIGGYLHLDWFRSLAFIRPDAVAKLTNTQMASLSMAQLAELDPSGLTTAQLSYKTNEGWTVAQGLSEEQVQCLSEATTKSLTAELLRMQVGTGRFLLETLANSQVGILTPQQFSVLEPWQIEKITGTALTTTQLKYKVANGQSVLENLTGKQITSLIYDVVSTLNIDQLSLDARGISVLSSLTPEQIRQLKLEVVIALSADQIQQKLSGNGSVLLALTYDQLKNIREAVIEKLSGTNLRVTNPDGKSILECLTTRQISALTAIQLAELNTRDLAGLNSSGLIATQLAYVTNDNHTVLSSLNATQISTLTTATLVKLTAPQLTSTLLEGRHTVLSVLKSKQISNLTFAQLLELSAEQIRMIVASDGLTLRQLRTLDKEGQTILSVLTTEQIQKIEPKIIREFSLLEFSNILSIFTPEQMGEFTEKQIQMLTPELFSTLSALQLEKLSSYACAAIDADKIKKLTPMQFSALLKGNGDYHYPYTSLNSVAIGSISATQMRGLNPGIFVRLSPYISSLSMTALGAIDSEQFKVVSSQFISEFSITTIRSLIGLFTSEQLNGISATQIQQIRPDEFSPLTANQLNGLNLTAASAISRGQMAALSWMSFGQLSSDFLKCLTADAVAGITPASFAVLSNQQIAAMGTRLSEDQFSGLNSTQIDIIVASADIYTIPSDDIVRLILNLNANPNKSTANPAIANIIFALDRIAYKGQPEKMEAVIAGLAEKGRGFAKFNINIAQAIAEESHGKNFTTAEKAYLRGQHIWSPLSGWGQINPVAALSSVAGERYFNWSKASFASEGIRYAIDPEFFSMLFPTSVNTDGSFVRGSDGEGFAVPNSFNNAMMSPKYFGDAAEQAHMNLVIADISSGVDADAAGRFYLPLNEWSWNFLSNTNDVQDDWSYDFIISGSKDVHKYMQESGAGLGNYTAQLMFARQFDSASDIVGAARGGELMVLKAVDDYGMANSKKVAEAIRYAVDHKANIINMSIQSSMSAALESAVQYASDHGVVVCMAVGTDGDFDPGYAASFAKKMPNVIAVGGSNASGDAMNLLSDRASTLSPFNFVTVRGVDSREGSALISAAVANLWEANNIFGRGLTSTQLIQVITSTATPLFH